MPRVPFLVNVYPLPFLLLFPKNSIPKALHNAAKADKNE
jgi:hypothetical protein